MVFVTALAVTFWLLSPSFSEMTTLVVTCTASGLPMCYND